MICAGVNGTIVSGCHGDSGGLMSARIPLETEYYKVLLVGAPQDALQPSDTQCLHVLLSSGTGLIRRWELFPLQVQVTRKKSLTLPHETTG